MPTPSRGAPEPKTVVIADDTAQVRTRFGRAIEKAGHRVLPVKGTAELLARVHADLDQIDLLILDLRLPHGGGTDLVQKVRKLDNGTLPILVFSGTVLSSDEVWAIAKMGVAGYISEYSAAEHILPTIDQQLNPDTTNRRGTKRVVLGIPIAYRVGKTTHAALTLNLSKGGLAIRTTRPLPEGEACRARFKLPGWSREFTTSAHVRWSRTEAGMGLQFDAVEPQDQKDIDAFVNAHAPARRGSRRATRKTAR